MYNSVELWERLRLIICSVYLTAERTRKDDCSPINDKRIAVGNVNVKLTHTHKHVLYVYIL